MDNLKIGDKVQWKQAPHSAAIIRRVLGSQYEVEFETVGPLKGQKLVLPAGQLIKMSLLEQMAVEVEPPDPFFRPKDHPDYGKESLYEEKDQE